MKYIQTNRFGSFIIVGIMAAFLVSCKKNDSGSDNNNTALKTPLVTSVDMEQLQSSTLLTRSSILFDYSGFYLTKSHFYKNGTEIGYAQFEYGTPDQISYIEHHLLNAASGFSNSSSPNLLTYTEVFTYNQNGDLDTYSTRTFFYGNGYNAPSNNYLGGKETYTYNSDGSVSVKVYTLYSKDGSSASELVTAIGSKVISLPSAGVKKVVYTNTGAGTTFTYTYTYDTKNNPFKNIAGSFQKLWVTPSYGVGSFDNGIVEDTGVLGDIFSTNTLLKVTGTDNTSHTYGYNYNAGNYPTSADAPNYTTLTYHYNQ